MEIPKVKGTDWRKILKRYNPEELEIDLIKRMLTYETKERIRPFEALKHAYFSDLVSFQEAHKLPELFEFDNLRNKKNKAVIIGLEQHFENQRSTYFSGKEG